MYDVQQLIGFHHIVRRFGVHVEFSSGEGLGMLFMELSLSCLGCGQVHWGNIPSG